VTVQYGGREFAGNVEVYGQTELRNCTLRLSGDYGLAVRNGGELLNHEGSGSGANTYLTNESGAAYVRTSTMHMLSADSTYTVDDERRTNDEEWVFVEADTASGAGRDSEQRTVAGIDVPYRMSGGHFVDQVEWIMDPGGRFEFTESSELYFGRLARMTISGIERRDEQEDLIDTIVFTGTDKQSGWWDGIYTQSDQTDNVLEHVIVEYGGDDLSGNLEVGTAFGEAGLVTIQNCTFRHADAYGLYAGSTTEFPDNKNNTYTDNVSGAASFRMDNIHYLSSKSDFQGNTNDIVEVRSGGLESGDLPSGETVATWDGINVPYEFTSSGDSGTTHSVNDVELQINPGATMQFQESGQLRFKPDSTLSIEGTDEDPITFTGLEEVKGWWDGIYVETNSFANVIDHAVIEYGGRGAGNNGLGGNIEMGTGFGDDASLKITNSTISHSNTNGIYADVNDQPGNANTIEQDNDFFENNGEDYATCDDNC